MNAEATWVTPVGGPPGSHSQLGSGHQPGSGGFKIHSTPHAIRPSANTTEIATRRLVSTPSAAPWRPCA